jgi:hypothetical protein
MRDAPASSQVGGAQTERLRLVRFPLIVGLGLALVSAGCSRLAIGSVSRPCLASEPCSRRASCDPCSGPYLGGPKIKRSQYCRGIHRKCPALEASDH